MTAQTSILVMVLASMACSSTATGPREEPKSQRSALGVFMKTKLNPPFSKLSFLLFHDQEESDPNALVAAATEMIAASEQLMKWPEPPSDDEQGRLVFYEYAGTLKNDADNLLGAVTAKQRDNAQKLFTDLRKKCDSCHHFFRYTGTLSLWEGH